MSSSDADPAELEREGQREADKLEKQSKDLGQDIENVDQDWRQKRADESVPGAKTPENMDESDDEPDEKSGDESDEEESGDESDEEKSGDESDEEKSGDESDDEDEG